MFARQKTIVILLVGLNILLGAALAMLLLFSEDEPVVIASRPAGNAESAEMFSISFSDSGFATAPGTDDYAVPKSERVDYLRSILDTLFIGRARLSDEEKSIRIFQYVASAMKLRNNSGTATSMLSQGYAFCYGKSKAFTTLCRVAGIPSRQISYMHVSLVQSHVLSEVFYDGAWHLYDPTYGVFFYSKPEYDNQGTVLSFHDLVENPDSGYPILGVPKTGVGFFNETIRRTPVRTALNSNEKLDDNGMSVAAYRDGIRKAFPVAYNSSDLISYPVDADISKEHEQWFGKVDNSGSEMGDYTPRFSGSHYLGQANPPGFHTWLIKTKPLSTITIEYYSTKSNPPELVLVPLRAAKVIETRTNGKKTTMTFYTAGNTAIVSVYCPENQFSVDAMRIFR